jgi:hypothetical protein
MSAFGQKQTFRRQAPMSALAPKADNDRAHPEVRFVLKADNVRCSKIALLITSSAATSKVCGTVRF